MAQDLRQASVSLPIGLYDRLLSECGSGRVSAYLRALLEGATADLDAAVARLEAGRVSPPEVEELAGAQEPPEVMGLLEAARVVTEQARMGRRLAVSGLSDEEVNR